MIRLGSSRPGEEFALVTDPRYLAVYRRVVSQIHRQRGHGENKEDGPDGELVIAHPQLDDQGADKEQDKADRSGRSQQRRGEADQQSERACGLDGTPVG